MTPLRDEWVRLGGLLVLIGAAWGLTQPLTKIAVSTGHPAMGLVFWQLVIGSVFLSVINALRGKRLPLTRRSLALYTFIAVTGTLAPNYASYTAIAHIPAGVASIIIAAVSLFAFPMALAMGTDRFSALRLAGLLLGLAGVAFIALPEQSLPDPGMVAWLPIALLAPLCYAFEGNVVGKYGTQGIDALVVLQGTSLVGVVLALPLMLGLGQWLPVPATFGPAEYALVTASLIHALVYALYVWLVGRAGAVFAAQTSTLVTGFGVLWAMLILGERYSLWVWVAFGFMLAGLLLVQPRKAQTEVVEDYVGPPGGIV